MKSKSFGTKLAVNLDRLLNTWIHKKLVYIWSNILILEILCQLPHYHIWVGHFIKHRQKSLRFRIFKEWLSFPSSAISNVVLPLAEEPRSKVIVQHAKALQRNYLACFPSLSFPRKMSKSSITISFNPTTIWPWIMVVQCLVFQMNKNNEWR